MGAFWDKFARTTTANSRAFHDCDRSNIVALGTTNAKVRSEDVGVNKRGEMQVDLRLGIEFEGADQEQHVNKVVFLRSQTLGNSVH